MRLMPLSSMNGMVNPMTETNAEWLEGIRWVNAARPLTREEAHRLIEQAERTQTLENSVKKAIGMQEYYIMSTGDLQDENERLREALEFYARLPNYEVELVPYPSPRLVGESRSDVAKDAGDVARQALKGDVP